MSRRPSISVPPYDAKQLPITIYYERLDDVTEAKAGDIIVYNRPYSKGFLLLPRICAPLPPSTTRIARAVSLPLANFARYGNVVFHPELRVLASFLLTDASLQHFLTQRPNVLSAAQLAGKGPRKYAIVEGAIQFCVEDGVIDSVYVSFDVSAYEKSTFTTWSHFAQFSFKAIPSWDDVLAMLWAHRQTQTAFYAAAYGQVDWLLLEPHLPIGCRFQSRAEVAFSGPLPTKHIASDAIDRFHPQCVKRPVSYPFMQYNHVLRRVSHEISYANSYSIDLWRLYAGADWTWHSQHARILNIAIALVALHLPAYTQLEIIGWIDQTLYHAPSDLVVPLLQGVLRSVEAIPFKRWALKMD